MTETKLQLPSSNNQAPAAPVQPMDPNAGAYAMPAADPTMAADPMADPNAMAGADMNGDSMPDDPNMGMDANGDGMPDDGGIGEEGIDGMDIQGIYDSLPDVDKDAAEGYLKYLKRKNEGGAEGQEAAPSDPNAMPAADPMAQQPMMESVVFSKKQLVKLQEQIGTSGKREIDNKPLSKKKNQKFNSKSPFGSKKFNGEQNL